MASSSLITSRQNPRVKDAVSLRDGRQRKRQGRFLIDGAREILRAVRAGIPCVEAFVCEDLLTTDERREAVEALQTVAAELLPVSKEVYEKVAFGEREEGVVVVAQAPDRRLRQMVLPPRPLIAVLEGIEKPGNVGAILRSADAAGVDAVVVADGRTDLFNPNTIRASLGTVFGRNVCAAAAEATVDWLGEHDVTIVAARPDADRLYTAADLSGGVAIVLGSEATGLSDHWRGANIRPVRLPMHGLADSLNVSTSAAVLFYEAVRQRAASR